MFMDPESWARLSREDRLAESRLEALRQLAASAEPEEGLRSQVGRWLIRLGSWIQGTTEIR